MSKAVIISAAAVKKLLMLLISDRKSLKFVGYAIGITVFIFMIPVITAAGMFGWMADSGGITSAVMDHAAENISEETFEKLGAAENIQKNIDSVFTEYGLSEKERTAAFVLCISYLTGKESYDNFYYALAVCFTGAENLSEVCGRVSAFFNVDIPESDVEKLADFFK